MKHIFTKLFVGYLLVIILLTSLILFFSFRNIRYHYIDSISEELSSLCLTSESKFKEFIILEDYENFNQFIVNLGKKIDKRITVVSSTGKVLADSKSNPDKMENHINRPEIQEAINGNTGQSIRYSTTMQDEMLYVAIPIYRNNELIGVSRFSVFLSSINNLTGKLASDIIRVAVIVVFLALIGVLVFTRNITRPINELSMASTKVATGNFDVKVLPKGKDEIFELSANFNEMTDKLKDLFDQVMTQKEEYYILISSIQEGLIALDENNRIVLSNLSFTELFDKKNVNGKLYWEIISEIQLKEMIDKIKNEKTNFSKEIEFGKRSFIVSANYIESKNETVLLFHDITDIKNLEKIKKDFVVNVSHELRTPLTAIKGFVETLEDEVEGENERYVQIIKRHTDRLINIVQDLITLSEVEEDSNKLLFTKVDLKLLLENLFLIFDQKVSEKKLNLKLDCEPNLPKIKVDAFRLEQVFINLIDNAIKYTDYGKIEVKVKSFKEFIEIRVSDTGIGIDKKDLGRVFERFYLVDKSRSSKAGGSGLGLSIVKHIVLLHNGTIEVESVKGNGTTFIIKLPL